MGYANDGFTAGKWKTVCSQFLKIGTVNNGEDMLLKDLTPGGTWAHGSDLIKVFADTSAVKFNAVYIWRNQVGQRTLDKYPEIQDGWYKFANDAVDYTQPMNAEPIPAGTGILGQSSSSEAMISIPTAL